MAFSVCAVVVTYGEREHLVRSLVSSLLKQAAIRAIVLVNNAAAWDVKSLARGLTAARIEVVEFERNCGAAAGFAAGMKRACELGAEFIWLLDDDNQPEEEALSELLSAYGRLRADFPADCLAVSALRPDHQPDVAAGLPVTILDDRRNSSFWGFHMIEVPGRLWRRTPWGRTRVLGARPPLVEMAVAPYGGLLFQRALIERHGLPRADFVLYTDDTEFTYRITRSGGAIRLVTSARIADLESSWRTRRPGRLPFRGWIEGENDLRAFYSARNQTYLDAHCRPHSPLAFYINRLIYCLGLWLYALLLRRRERYLLLREAIHNGLAGHLGLDRRYPL